MSVWSDWGEGSPPCPGLGSGSLMEAATQPKPGQLRRGMWVTVPLHPRGPSRTQLASGQGTSSILSPDRSMPAAPPVPETRQKSTEQPPMATPAPRSLPWATSTNDHQLEGGRQQATCPAGQGTLRPGKAWLGRAGRAGLGRSRGQQGALQERLGHRAAGPQSCPRQPAQTSAFSREPPPHPRGLPTPALPAPTN